MIRELIATGVTVSVETMRASVAGAAVSEGVTIVNSVSGGLADPDMARALAESGVTYVAMHWRGRATGCGRGRRTQMSGEGVDELRIRLAARVDAGVSPARVVLDLGLGFGKRPSTTGS